MPSSTDRTAFGVVLAGGSGNEAEDLVERDLGDLSGPFEERQRAVRTFLRDHVCGVDVLLALLDGPVQSPQSSRDEGFPRSARCEKEVLSLRRELAFQFHDGADVLGFNTQAGFVVRNSIHLAHPQALSSHPSPAKSMNSAIDILDQVFAVKRIAT